MAPEGLNTPLGASEAPCGSTENLSANYPVSHPSTSGMSGTSSPPVIADRRPPSIQRPNVVSELPRPPSTDIESPQQLQVRAEARTSSPARSNSPHLPLRAPVIGPGGEQHSFPQHNSMLLSSLMGNR